MIYSILALAAFLRLFKLGSLPISLFGDEIDVGYHAWSLITTGRDYMGNLLPAYIQSLAEWRAPLLMYVTAPFVGILGPTPLAVRLPVALLGVLNIYLIYLLTNQLFSRHRFSNLPSGLQGAKRLKDSSEPLLETGNWKLEIGHLAALLLAISPWHIHYSRVAFESTLLLTLLLAGALFFIKKRYSLSILSFILTFYTYSTANLFTPLFGLSLFLIYRQTKGVASQLIKKSYLLVFLLPIAYHLTLGQAAGRFKLISVFSDKNLVYDVINQRTSPWVNQDNWQEKIFHNKAISYAGKIGSNYLSAFSPQFLFISGDPNFRHSIGKFGELLWITAPFLILGTAYLLSNIKNKANQLILAWTLIAPIPSSLTAGGAMHATRLILLLPPLTIISALGTWQSLKWLKISPRRAANKADSPVSVGRVKWGMVLVIMFVVATTLNITAYWHRYSAHYKLESARHWHYGYQDIFEKLSPLTKSANRIFINNTYEPSLLRFAFFTQYPPSKFQQDLTTDVPKENVIKGFDGFRFGDKYYFGQARNLNDLFMLLGPGDIYLAVQGKEVPGDWDWSKEPPPGFQVLGSTKDVLNNPLFYLVTKDQL